MTAQETGELRHVTLSQALATAVERWPRHGHGAQDRCPGCDGNCREVALVRLAYVFDTCACGEPEYDHLVEQLWHTACLQAAGSDTDD